MACWKAALWSKLETKRMAEARSRRASPRRSAQEHRQPQYHTGPKGGTYVLSAKGEKLYVPTTAAKWEITANGRWRLTLRDGRSMVYPMLQ